MDALNAEILCSIVTIYSMAQQSGVPLACSMAYRDDALKAKHKVFLSHSEFQKAFVRRLYVALERCNLYPFFDDREGSSPIGGNFSQWIFDAVGQCDVGVVVLSEEFFLSKSVMVELVAIVDEVEKREESCAIILVFLHIFPDEIGDPENRNQWRARWHKMAQKDRIRVEVEK